MKEPQDTKNSSKKPSSTTTKKASEKQQTPVVVQAKMVMSAWKETGPATNKDRVFVIMLSLFQFIDPFHPE